MLETKALSREVTCRYQVLYDETMILVQAYHRKRHEVAVRELIQALRGEVFEKNSNVRRLVEEASADGVRLDPASYLGDLVEDNFGFLISKLREKCWTGEGIRNGRDCRTRVGGQ